MRLRKGDGVLEAGGGKGAGQGGTRGAWWLMVRQA
jgi:hypothetical protein